LKMKRTPSFGRIDCMLNNRKLPLLKNKIK